MAVICSFVHHVRFINFFLLVIFSSYFLNFGFQFWLWFSFFIINPTHFNVRIWDTFKIYLCRNWDFEEAGNNFVMLAVLKFHLFYVIYVFLGYLNTSHMKKKINVFFMSFILFYLFWLLFSLFYVICFCANISKIYLRKYIKDASPVLKKTNL